MVAATCSVESLEPSAGYKVPGKGSECGVLRDLVREANLPAGKVICEMFAGLPAHGLVGACCRQMISETAPNPMNNFGAALKIILRCEAIGPKIDRVPIFNEFQQ